MLRVRITDLGRLLRPRSHLRINLPSIDTGLANALRSGLGILPNVFRDSDDGVIRRLPASWSNLTRTDRCWVFASSVAHNLKPYGPGTTADLAAMLNADTLDCSNYGILTHLIASACLPGTVLPSPTYVGWDGGAAGNHQMLFVGDAGQSGIEQLMLDPTLGLVARASFNQIASGRPVPSHNLLAVNATPQLAPSRLQMIAALRRGSFRPADMLYYFETIEQLLTKFGHPGDWPTPGASFWRSQQISRGLK